MLSFNNSGLLIPNGPIKSSVSAMHFTFVEEYSSVERSALFESYKLYSEDLKALCKGIELKQWVNGSFATHAKTRPGDIDLVTFIAADVIVSLGNKISRFIYPNSKINYPGIDGYIVSVFPEESKNHTLFKSDELHWFHTFNTTRRNRQGNKLPKGFLEIMY